MATAPELLVVGLLHTLDPARPVVQAALVRDGRFACVGTIDACASRAAPGVRRVEVGSAVPGLVDAHGHVMALGRAELEVSCAGLESEDACVARAAERARRAEGELDPRPRLGSEPLATAGVPPRRGSRAVPDHPVLLVRVDGHAGWANGSALAAAGIGPDTKDPPGGKIVRDAGGRPTGVLVDTAMELLLRRIPAPTPAEIEEALRRGMDALVGLGITAAHDAGVTPEVLDVYRRLASEDRLPLRVYAMIEGEGTVANVVAQMARWKATPEVGRLTVRAVKIYADGALGSRGAALHEDYADDPGNRGLFLTAPALLGEKVRAVVQAGLQPAIHAIGDRGISETIAAIEGAEIAPPCARCGRGSSTPDPSGLRGAAARGSRDRRLDAALARDERRAVGPRPARRRHAAPRRRLRLALGRARRRAARVRLGLPDRESGRAARPRRRRDAPRVGRARAVPARRAARARRGAARVHVGRGVRGVRGGAARDDPRGV
jgi:predicted amidohydrolase YtcJ